MVDCLFTFKQKSFSEKVSGNSFPDNFKTRFILLFSDSENVSSLFLHRLGPPKNHRILQIKVKQIRAAPLVFPSHLDEQIHFS